MTDFLMQYFLAGLALSFLVTVAAKTNMQHRIAAMVCLGIAVMLGVLTIFNIQYIHKHRFTETSVLTNLPR